jgi:hypothetical protein
MKTKPTTARTKVRKAKLPNRYHYRRDRDGVDDTWDIYHPDDTFMVSIRFWDDFESDEAARSEARAKLIVDTLNAGYWWKHYR